MVADSVGETHEGKASQRLEGHFFRECGPIGSSKQLCVPRVI